MAIRRALAVEFEGARRDRRREELCRSRDAAASRRGRNKRVKRISRHISASRSGLRRWLKAVGSAPAIFSVPLATTLGQRRRTYLAHRRIERAQMLTLSTRQSLTDIALASGSCDEAYFCRHFHRITGQTPKAWRWFYAEAPAVN